MDSAIYQPLPGRGFGIFRRDRLWLAEDHLLSVRSSRMVDTYERYYFRDIQGIYFRDRRGEFLMILAAHLVPCISLAIFTAIHSWFWLIPLAPLAAWTAAYAWLGSQADCHIQTLLGSRSVPAISRRPAYDQLVERLIPLVEGEQGRLDTVAFEVVAPAPAALAPPPMESVAPLKPADRGWYFEYAFVTVAIAGAFSLWNHRGAHGAFFDWTEYTLSLAALLLMLVGLARAYRFEVGGPVLACLWSIISVQAVYSMGTGVVASLQNAAPRVPGSVRMVDQHPIRSRPDFLPYATTMEGLCIALAIVGLLLVIDRKNRQPA